MREGTKHGPPFWTRSMDHFHGLGPWTPFCFGEREGLYRLLQDNTRHKSLKQTPDISTSHCFPLRNVPSPSPMLSHACFEAMKPL